VGFGFGDAVIMELLKSKKLLPDMTKKVIVDVVVCSLLAGDSADDDQVLLQKLAIQAAAELRKEGLTVDLILENKRAKWMFQRADKLNAGMLWYVRHGLNACI
jgi:histidyl-tRNA synthetase